MRRSSVRFRQAARIPPAYSPPVGPLKALFCGRLGMNWARDRLRSPPYAGVTTRAGALSGRPSHAAPEARRSVRRWTPRPEGDPRSRPRRPGRPTQRHTLTRGGTDPLADLVHHAGRVVPEVPRSDLGLTSPTSPRSALPGRWGSHSPRAQQSGPDPPRARIRSVGPPQDVGVPVAGEQHGSHPSSLARSGPATSTYCPTRFHVDEWPPVEPGHVPVADRCSQRPAPRRRASPGLGLFEPPYARSASSRAGPW